MVHGNFSLKEIIDLEHIQHLAQRFCEATGVFGYGVDSEGKAITTLCGHGEDVGRIAKYLDKEQAGELIRRVETGSLEEQVVEGTAYANLMSAAIAIHINGKHMVTWVVYGINSDAKPVPGEDFVMDVGTMMHEDVFFHVLDILRDISYLVLENKMSLVDAYAEAARSRNSENEMELSLRQIEATTKIVQLLDSDDTLEDILAETLKIVGKHLKGSSAQCYNVHNGKQTMDVVCEWCNEGVVSFFDKTKGLPVFSFLNQDKPLVISADSFANTDAGEALYKHGVRAIIVFPVHVQDKKTMYFCLTDMSEGRMWQVDEIKFIRDVAKLLQSVVQRQMQKMSLTDSYISMEAILENMNSGIYVRDAQTKKALFMNQNMKEVFAPQISKGTINELLERNMPGNKECDSLELYYKDLEQWYDLLYNRIIWVDGRDAELFCLYDITDRKIYQRKIEQQAYTDFLTGLYNRMCCERDLASHIDNAKKNNLTGAVLYMDLDDFKHINDGLGHQYGDILLKAISNNLRNIKGIEDTCYRMGGDEFVIIIPPDCYDEFLSIVDQIKQIFSKPWYLKDADYYCTMSMGIVNYPRSGDNVQELIVKADIAMYEAKKAGKNRIEYYSESIADGSHKRLDMEKNMRDATVNGYEEFEVYFQPVTDIQLPDTPCVGAEALIRWNSTELGFIAPSEFIPLAEYLGLINPIGNHVLRTACLACKSWNDNGHPNYKVNVNLSVIQLLQPDIVDIVAEILAETGITPKNLTLEVTESLAINDMERMKEILGNIKKLGVRIALDDFGTGYSSLNHIREIPLDVIKVDQSFVKDLAEDAYSQSFIKMVSELADTIGVDICVEGIETKAQYKVLEGMKVRLIQGYYFGRPMPQYEFEERYCR